MDREQLDKWLSQFYDLERSVNSDPMVQEWARNNLNAIKSIVLNLDKDIAGGTWIRKLAPNVFDEHLIP